MPAGGGQTTRNLRGKGANIEGLTASAELDGVNYSAAKFNRIYWEPTDNEALTPGSGVIPNRVVGMAWEAYGDNQDCAVFFNRSTRAGIFNVGSGTPNGYLLVWSR